MHMSEAGDTSGPPCSLASTRGPWPFRCQRWKQISDSGLFPGAGAACCALRAREWARCGPRTGEVEGRVSGSPCDLVTRQWSWCWQWSSPDRVGGVPDLHGCLFAVPGRQRRTCRSARLRFCRYVSVRGVRACVTSDLVTLRLQDGQQLPTNLHMLDCSLNPKACAHHPFQYGILSQNSPADRPVIF